MSKYNKSNEYKQNQKHIEQNPAQENENDDEFDEKLSDDEVLIKKSQEEEIIDGEEVIP